MKHIIIVSYETENVRVWTEYTGNALTLHTEKNGFESKPEQIKYHADASNMIRDIFMIAWRYLRVLPDDLAPSIDCFGVTPFTFSVGKMEAEDRIRRSIAVNKWAPAII